MRLSRVAAVGCWTVAALSAARGAAPASQPAPFRLPFTISKETTVITGPLRADGTVDYPAALNARYNAGVTPENNGFALWLQVVGTSDHVLPTKAKAEILRLCGVGELPAGAEVWEGYEAYLKRTKNLSDTIDASNEITAAAREAWRPEDHPNLVAFIQSHEKILTVVAQVAGRPKWWMPLVPSDGYSMFTIDLPSLTPFKEVVETLCARAVGRGTQGDFDGFLSDIRTVRKLARQLGGGPTLIERLVAVAVDVMALNAVGAVAASGSLNEQQCKMTRQVVEDADALPTMVEGLDTVERWNVLDAVQWIALGKGGQLVHGTYLDAKATKNIAFDGLSLKEVDWDTVFRRCNGAFDDQMEAMQSGGIRALKTSVSLLDQRSEELEKRFADVQPVSRRLESQTRADYTELVGSRLLMTWMPNIGKAEELYRRGKQWTEMTRVIVACAQMKARTGTWPAALQDLVPEILPGLPSDMYSADGSLPFRFVIRNGGIRVYSVGENGKDDGGILDAAGKDDLGIGVK